MPLRVVFFGTPAFAVPSLSHLLESRHAVVGVVTQPDRPRGRGYRVEPGAVKARASSLGLTVLQPESLKDEAFRAALERMRPDVGVVAAYGRRLPQWLLDLPRMGLINVHASLLPRWRGAAPVHRAVMAGDRTTGVTIMRVVLELDAGPILSSAMVDIDPNETSANLEVRLADLGAELLAGALDRLAGGSITATPQEASAATYASRLTRRDSHVDWARPAREIHNQIRGLHPWPLAEAMLLSRRILLLRSRVGDESRAAAEPGVIVTIERDAIEIAAKLGTVRLYELQPEGRVAMDVRAFLNGTRVSAGDRFEPLPGPGP